MKTFASYGSLKKGYWNHDRYGLGEPIATSEVYGEMYVNPSLGYPHLYETSDEKPLANPKFYEVELYDIEDAIFNRIDMMEQASGYYPKEITFILESGAKQNAVVWFADSKWIPKPEHYVEEYAKI
jgi:gamma-glutamylcyclotransferase (GGCT)/AIG2-like uncharacterized protein YtfP